MRPSSAEVLARVLERLERYADGVHELGDPAFLLDTELPERLADLYRTFDGGRLFHEELILSPSSTVRPEDGRIRIGEFAGDDLYVESDGRVTQLEEDTGELIVCGTAIDRWLAGFVDAAALLYDREGEFLDGVFTESGEVDDAVELSRQWCFVKRDPRAPGPRWRLARLLFAAGKTDEARRHLEDVADAAPGFAWAWFDLSKISESLGQLEGAHDEMIAAAEADEAGDQRAFFYAHAARIAGAAEMPAEAAEATRLALSADPALVDGLLRAVESEMLQDRSPTGLLALARAIAPRDLRVIDLGRRLGSTER